MFNLTTTFILLSIVVIVAAYFLADSADVIAEGTGIGRSMAGLVLLAGATSLPELIVGWTGVTIGAIDLTVGELLGSCLLNLLILAIMDLGNHSRGRMLSRLAAAHALSAVMCILLAAIVLLGLLISTNINFLRLGPGTWAIAIVYIAGMRIIYNDQQLPRQATASETVHKSKSLFRAIQIYFAAGLAIFLAAPELARVAEQLAHETGLGETFFGTVFVALMTSLPEIVSTYSALRIGAFDMAVGNIFGSNSINIFILSIVDVATPGSILATASLTHLVTATAVIIVTAVATVGLLYHAEKRILLIEPDALLMILLILGALYLVYDNPIKLVLR